MTHNLNPASDQSRGVWGGVRSLLFVPAHVERFYRKAVESAADALALDLEDAIPAPLKHRARDQLVDLLKRHGRPSKPTLVRVNDQGTEWHDADVRELARAGVDGFMLPKVKTPDDVLHFDAVLDELEAKAPPPSGSFVVFPLIETASAVMKAFDIASASNRVAGVVFGHEDYLLGIQAEHDESRRNLIVPRSLIALAARAAGCIPIDTPYLDIRNRVGCREHVRESRGLGFSGMLVLHPLQIEVANTGYAPSIEAIEHAQKVVHIDSEAKKENRSIAFADGEFVAPPILKQAQALLQRAKDLGINPGGSEYTSGSSAAGKG